MANRKKRKERYLELVKERLEDRDVVIVPTDQDHIITARGAKVHMDITKHPELEIASLTNERENGLAYDVLAVGMMGDVPTVTIQAGDLTQVYRLPSWYADWIQVVMTGPKFFPGRVEFGYFPDKDRYYAELL
jgi:hypothetical protein